MASSEIAAAPCPGSWLPYAIQRLRERPTDAPTVRFEIPPPPKGTFDIYMALSPDGRRLAFTSAGSDGVLRIWVRDLDSVQARALPGTESAQSLFWSPDSRSIAFGFGTQLKKVDLSGGPPVTLCTSATPVGSGAWSSTGTIVFGGRGTGPLQRVPESGGIPAPLTALDPSRRDVYHSHPSFLPDGTHFIYFNATLESQHGIGIYTGSLDAKPQEQNSKQLLATPTNAVFTPGTAAGEGYLLFLRDGTLMAQPLDTRKLELTGEPAPLAEGVGRANSLGNFSVSASGSLAYRLGAGLGTRAGRGDSDLVWLGRDGKRLNAVLPGVDMNFETLSPDGKILAYTLNSADGLEDDIWLYDLTRGTSTRFTFGPGNAVSPIWSPDGARIVYNWGSGGAPNDIYIKDANGASKESLLLKVGTPLRIYDWSHDGKSLVFGTIGNDEGLQLLAMQGERKASPYVDSKFSQFNAQVSPDNRWMAYTSNESGANQVYVQPIPPTGGKWQISAAGGNRARWRKDGKELYFVDAQQNLMVVEIRAGAAFAAGIPQMLFRTPITQLNAYQFFYIPAPDGKKFLMRVPASTVTPPPVTVVLNWRSALKLRTAP